MSTPTSPARRRPSRSQLVGLFLAAFFTLFAVGVLFGDHVFHAAITVLGDTPAPLITVLAWLPAAVAWGCLTADAADPEKPAMRQPWPAIGAAAVLIVAVELPSALRHSYRRTDAYATIAASPTGGAIVAGMAAGLFPVFAWFLLLLTPGGSGHGCAAPRDRFATRPGSPSHARAAGLRQEAQRLRWPGSL